MMTVMSTVTVAVTVAVTVTRLINCDGDDDVSPVTPAAPA